MTQLMQHDPSVPDRVVEGYDAKVIGAPFKILLMDGYTKQTDPVTGKVMVEIEDLPGLIAAAVRSRVLHPRILSGEDLKFIRSALCMKSKKVAELLGMTPENYSRCEHGTKFMSEVTEKYYRQNVYLSVQMRNLGLTETAVACQKQGRFDAQEAQKALAAFQKIFLDMRIDKLRLVGKDLCFKFYRRCDENLVPCGSDDGRWHDRSCRAA